MACCLHFLTRGLPPFQAHELKGMVADECRLVSASVWSQTTWLWSVLCAGPVSGDPQFGGKSPRPRRSHSPAGDRPGDLEDAWSVCLPPDNPPVCSLWPCPARICWDRGTAAPHLPALCQAPPSHVRKLPDVDGLGMASMFFPTPPGSRPCSRVSPFPAPHFGELTPAGPHPVPRSLDPLKVFSEILPPLLSLGLRGVSW